MREWGCIGCCVLIGGAWGFFALGLDETSVLILGLEVGLGVLLGGAFGVLIGRRVFERLIEWLP